jgi:superfamily II DNA/RNA helicase
VFCRTRRGADRLTTQLERAGVRAAAIHGGRSQSQRDRALAAFKVGNVEALIATDVAARGIHVDGVACVLHYDTPEDGKAYLHRSGRTARAGASGLVVSLVGHGDTRTVARMQRELEIPAPMTPPNLTAISGTLATVPARVVPNVSLDRVRQSRTSTVEPRRSPSRRNSNRSSAQRGAPRPNRSRSASRRAS